ncbi:hypothetical protein AB0G32_22915 [Streptomyces sp. NPDC023723]|uniref:hypothetical protein n=1 Tax=Streptomyces sp. NPDC023723 TaxID=3154323 RepID=UPI0033D6CAEE
MPTSLPSAKTCTVVRVGQHWDAIRVPRSVGLSAMVALGSRSGAVLDDAAGAVHFFVPLGTADVWTDETSRALVTGLPLTVPPPLRIAGPGAHWRLRPGDRGMLTDPDALAAALADAFGPPLGKEETT